MVVAAEQGRPDIARRRQQWLKYRTGIDPARMVFIDDADRHDIAAETLGSMALPLTVAAPWDRRIGN